MTQYPITVDSVYLFIWSNFSRATKIGENNTGQYIIKTHLNM